MSKDCHLLIVGCLERQQLPNIASGKPPGAQIDYRVHPIMPANFHFPRVVSGLLTIPNFDTVLECDPEQARSESMRFRSCREDCGRDISTILDRRAVD